MAPCSPSGRYRHAYRAVNVTLREISLFQDIHVVLALFSSREARVQYAAGAAASVCLNEATRKAVEECEQGHFLMDDNLERLKAGRKLVDSIQENYASHNTHETAHPWPTINERFTPAGSIPHATAAGTLSKLADPPFMISDSAFWDGVEFHVSRFFSDSWYCGLHDTARTPSAVQGLANASRHITSPVPFG